MLVYQSVNELKSITDSMKTRHWHCKHHIHYHNFHTKKNSPKFGIVPYSMCPLETRNLSSFEESKNLSLESSAPWLPFPTLRISYPYLCHELLGISQNEYLPNLQILLQKNLVFRRFLGTKCCESTKSSLFHRQLTRKKSWLEQGSKPLWHSMKYWLFTRDPYIGLF